MQRQVNTAPVTMADVARAANVSKVTASKVLSVDTAKNTRVSEETRERILEIAQRLGYRQNIAARVLAGKQSNAIGVIIDSNSPASHFFRVSLMEAEARKLGFRIMIGQCRPDLDNIMSVVEDFMSRGIDGIISMAHIYPHIGREVIKFLQGRGIKTVYCDMPFEDVTGEYYIETDLAQCIAQAVEHFHKQGRRRIMLFLPQQNLAYGRFEYVLARERGYRETVARLDLPELIYPQELSEVQSKPDCDKVFDMLDAAMEQHQPDAIVAQNDIAAGMVLRYCHLRGIEVPAQLAVIGYDNLEFASFTYPSLSTLDPLAGDVAGEAVRMMVEQIEGREANPRAVRIVPELIVRESG